jgi:hypothetical protein
MTGPLIYSISEDPVAAAKVLNDFAKTNDKLVVKAGSFAGELLDKAGVQDSPRFRVARNCSPSCLGMMQAPVTGFACALAALAKQREEARPSPDRRPRHCQLLQIFRFRSLLIMAITKEDILEAVGAMTVMELNDLVKAFEEKFGVSAASMAVAGLARLRRWLKSRPSLPSC